MKARMAIVGAALSLLAGPGFAAAPSIQGSTREPTSRNEAKLLRSLEDLSLLSLRAGIVPARAVIGDEERGALRAAQARSPDLGSMRGGVIDLSDHDIKLIVIALAIVLILIII